MALLFALPSDDSGSLFFWGGGRQIVTLNQGWNGALTCLPHGRTPKDRPVEKMIALPGMGFSKRGSVIGTHRQNRSRKKSFAVFIGKRLY